VGLSEYRRKRDFSKTPEPVAKARGASGNVFVVQKHAAQSTHYDLRLQVGGALKSWAVPRGPSLDPREKRLAVEVEDHPLEYATFEGVIPEEQYGAGPVMVWDRGRWFAEEGDAAKAIDEGMLKFRLEGERLRGRWMLVRTKGKEKQPHWLLVKERDSEASAGVGSEAFPTSVASGRTMDEIAAGAPARLSAEPKAASSAPTGAREAVMPKTLRPQLAVPGEKAPAGDNWLHEVKFDGYRLLIFRRGESVRILSRSGLDWTAKLPDLVKAVLERVPEDAVLDGEAVVLDNRGVSDFQALQNAIHNRRSKAIVFIAFDLPWCNGLDLTRTPLEERKERLAALIGRRQEGRLRFSEHFEGSGASVLDRIREHGLEGIVSKRRGSPYSQARTPDWVKVKCFNQQEFVIGGYSAPEGSREELGALLVGYHDDAGALRFAGKVGTGFSAETLKKLGRALRERLRATPPFANPPSGAEARGVTWIRPELVAQVQFRDWTSEGVIRHTSFRGLREDIDPKSVVREAASVAAPVSAPRSPRPTRPAPAKTASERARATHFRLTHPERVVFPDRGAGYALTKRQLADYYEAVAPLMLPHVVNRPLAILRAPDGEGGKTFFQKHPARGMPPAVRGVDVPSDEGEQRQLLIRDAEGLLGLVQMSALEFHPWGSTASDLEHPDRLIFDLDPGSDVSWRQIVEAARTVREALKQVGLTGFAKVSGGKGIHVVVPLRPRTATWEHAKVFTKAVAETLAKASPRRFVAVVTPSARAGRVYIDYQRNTRGATAVAPYSTRARPGGPIALPVAWDELDGLDSAAAFSPASVLRRLASGSPDPWEGMERAAGTLPEALRR
jgi:bifunctional non-homologous end joining protein LigD